jgi:hypothetical protein
MNIPSAAALAIDDRYRRAAIIDLAFLEAWEKGFIPYWSAGAVLRVRQIRRAHLTAYDAVPAKDVLPFGATLPRPGRR